MRPAIILFARSPVPGRVKTRLQPLLGPAGAADLHRALVADMLEKLRGCSDFADIELHTDVPAEAWLDTPVLRKLQIEGDLGLRLFHALNQALAEGRPQAAVVGSDSPTLPCSHLEGLLASKADVAFGPCEDGGFYAIACRRIHPQMFLGVSWSTPLTLEQSECAARRRGLSVERGKTWYDIDDAAALARLARDPGLTPRTAEWLSRNHYLQRAK